jgi:DNA-binding transcriptional regulator YiaG
MFRAMPKGQSAMTGDQLRTLRERCKLTQAEAADRLAVHVGTVRNWEQGRRAISPAMAKHIKTTLAK